MVPAAYVAARAIQTFGGKITPAIVRGWWKTACNGPHPARDVTQCKGVAGAFP